MSATPSTPCPRCGAASQGPFCSQCGLPFGNRPCRSCGAMLSASARFCPQCGATASGGAAPPVAAAPRSGSRTPWPIVGLLTVITIAAVVYAVREHEARPAADATQPRGTPPDLSKLTLREQFNELNDRVTRAAEQGDSATVVDFWPMAAAAYANLPPGDRDVDARFHMAWLHIVVGDFPQALALADTIMTGSPDNLFGYYIRASVATAQGDSAGAGSARAAFRSHFDAEVKQTDHQEYLDHRAMLDRFLKAP